MHRFSVARAAVMLLFVATGLCALIGRVAYLQTYGREQTIRKAERQQHQDETLYSRRGGIFDTNGMLMAGTVQQISLFIDAKFMQDQFEKQKGGLGAMDQALEKLGPIVDRNPFELAKLLGDRSASRFLRVADNIDEQSINAIKKLNLPGVGFAPVNVRYYPMGSIAAHILGGVGGEGKGLDGLEMKFEKLLAGKDGFKRTLKDGSRSRHPIAVDAEDYLPPQNGQHLVLTIDTNIQMIVEQELAETCKEHGAKAGESVVMDPLTGDVLAIANWPTFNPQNLEDSQAATRRNRALTDPYEPGSTIKPFIVGPALEWKITKPTEVFPISGEHYKSPLRPKLVTDVFPYKNLALWDVLVKSSNIGMTMLGEHMGKPNVYKALSLWQFGKTTGIELPGEDPGLLRPAAKWSNSDLVSSVQGYSVMVTPLQLTRAMCTYANGGRLIQPRIVRGVLDDVGEVTKSRQRPLDQFPEVINGATTAQMRRILADVVIRGTATAGRSDVWNIFGKTGTAHVAAGGSYAAHYTASFVGGAPYENPRLVIAFIIHDPDPTKVHYGGHVAAPGAGKVLERSLAYLQVPASPQLQPPPPEIASLLWSFDPRAYKSKAFAKADH